MESDPKGRRAAKLYQFGATSTDQSVLTVIAVLRPSGIQMFPQSTHGTEATVGSAPQPGKGLVRGIASLLGQNQYKITQKVHDGSPSRQDLREQVSPRGPRKRRDRISVREAQTNAQLANDVRRPGHAGGGQEHPGGRPGKLRSQPEFVLIDGHLRWRGAGEQVGAEMPKPSKFLTAGTGVSADVHLGSVMTNFAGGFFEAEQVKSVKNLMVVTKNVPPGTPPKEGVQVSENVDYPTFLKAVNDARAAKDPKVQALRIKKPGKSPEFSVDRNGYLIAIVNDFVLDVPAPESAAKGGLAGLLAQVYRIEAPAAEIALSVQVVSKTANSPIRLTGRIEGFEAGPGARSSPSTTTTPSPSP